MIHPFFSTEKPFKMFLEGILHINYQKQPNKSPKVTQEILKIHFHLTKIML